jgi:hypothetical protein
LLALMTIRLDLSIGSNLFSTDNTQKFIHKIIVQVQSFSNSLTGDQPNGSKENSDATTSSLKFMKENFSSLAAQKRDGHLIRIDL